MPNSYDVLIETTRLHRLAIADLLRSLRGREDEIPAGWSNNARWHAGHLLLTPRGLTLRILGEPLGVPAEYRDWFAKGTSPADWKGATLPSFDDLVDQLAPSTMELMESLRPRLTEPYPEVYTTTVGAKLTCALEALTLSSAHDGIHYGLLLALKRSLD